MEKNVKTLRQKGNACGTTSLAMILNAFPTVVGKTFTQEDLDKRIREWDEMFTAPVSAADLAREFGLASRLCNDGDFDLLDRMTKRGNVCQLLVDAPDLTAGSNLAGNLHYVVVDKVWEGRRSLHEATTRDAKFYTYAATDAGQWVRVKDPHDLTYIIRYDDFEKNYWSKLHLQLFPTGFNNFVIVYGEKEKDIDLSGYSTFNVSASLVLSTNSAELLNAIVHTAHFYADGLPKVIKNAAETALGAVAFVVKTPGTVLNQVSAEGVKAGIHLLRSDSSVLEKTAGVIVTPVSSAVWLGSKPVEWLGDGFGFITSFLD